MEKQEKSAEVDQSYQDVNDIKENQKYPIMDSDHDGLVESLNEQIESLQEKLLRQLAESENIRTRSSRLVEEAKDYAIFGFTKDLIPVMDNLSRALENLPEPEHLEGDMKNLVEGVKMTKSELESVFRNHSLESIEPQSGDKFDYHLHHAISQVMAEEYEEGTIVGTMQVGYIIKDRLIRPAAVAVAKSN